MELGPRVRCAIEYLIDCCEVAKEIVEMPAAKRRALQAIHRKRDGRWEEADRELRTAFAKEPAKGAKDAISEVVAQGAAAPETLATSSPACTT